METTQPNIQLKELQNVVDAIIELQKNPDIIVQNSHTEKNLYFKIGKRDSRNFTGIGYDNERKYFYHNTHAGNIMSPSSAPNGVWNHSSKDKPGPQGWYTFTEQYIIDLLNTLK